MIGFQYDRELNAMKIGILYICTGIYEIFWKDFYLSSEKYFIPEVDKEYWVFTDAESIYDMDKENVHVIYQESLGWPGNTLFRFKVFKQCWDEYDKCDYLFFCNANVQFMEKVTEDILDKEKITVVQHPGFWREGCDKFPYDRNPESGAYIAKGQGNVYVMGGLNGGPTKIYKKLITDLELSIDKDYAKGIVALWHDESHINKYIQSHPYKLLNPSYGYPQGWFRFPFKKIVLLRDKVLCGGRQFIKNKNWSVIEQVRYYLNLLFNIVRKH